VQLKDNFLNPDKLLSLEDLIQLQREAGAPASGAPKGMEFPAVKKKQMLVPKQPWSDFQEGNPNPQMGFLMWLLSKMRGGLWGQPERPDMLQDQWLQQQQQRPQRPRWDL